MPFSSPALRIFSLIMYTLLLIPGVNLIPPFLFFFALHIYFNWLCRRFWNKQETNKQDTDNHNHNIVSSQERLEISSLSSSTPRIYTAFLVVGLLCLVAINVVLLTDIELTLSRNQQNQSHEEDQWGFGQVLALLLLVVPLRDFVASINDIRDKVREQVQKRREEKKEAQKKFDNFLREAIRMERLEDPHVFSGLVDRRANPNTRLPGIFSL